MKRTKIFIGNKRLKDIYVGATGWDMFRFKAVRFFGVGFKGLKIALLINIGIWLGAYLYPVTQIKAVEIEVPSNDIPPILRKIAKAESWDSHYCTKEIVKLGGCAHGAIGQVLVNSTRDVGRYAINLYYNGKFCADKGFNIFDEEQNELCALALFHEYGSEPWSASKYKWSK